MMAPLRVRQFFPFFMGYFVPLFYVFSLLVLMGQKECSKQFTVAFAGGHLHLWFDDLCRLSGASDDRFLRVIDGAGDFNDDVVA